jgi:carbon monoxide dehydrogenase subunit G
VRQHLGVFLSGIDRYGTMRNELTGTLNIVLVSYSAAKELLLIVVGPAWNRNAMDLAGSYTIPAKQSAVWAALNDLNILIECIPGCETTLSMLSETEFAATIVVKVGPLKARFNGKVELSEIDPNNSYRMQGEGSGGAAGFAKGSARVHLQGAGDSTVLTYEIEAQIGGELAQLGSRLITDVVKSMAEEFFSTLVSKVSQSPCGS